MGTANDASTSIPVESACLSEMILPDLLGDQEFPVWPSEVPGLTLDDYFIENRSYHPPVPCSHCSRLGLACFIIQTTSANPNPVSSCSSCVALFRECSLARGEKRPPSNFETPQPVIGQLHGVNEEGTVADSVQALPYEPSPVNTTARASNSKKAWSRSVRKTQILRNWFACHLDHPYPTEDEKSSLARQSKLTKTQVSCWLANARRRYRQSTRDISKVVFPQGSPVPPSPFSNMTPFERWRNSPPEDEPVSMSTIEKSLSSFLGANNDRLDAFGPGDIDSCNSSSSRDPEIYACSVLEYTSSNSASSCYSYQFSAHSNFQSPSLQSSDDGKSTVLPSPVTRPVKRCIYQCTFCRRTFKKKYDWLRHEKSIHLPGLDSWVCAIPVPADQPLTVWRVKQGSPECLLCGHNSPTEEHMQSHEFEACSERPLQERTFPRKDHLWQHLYKFHGCRKWAGWNPNLNLLQQSQDGVRSYCGFCWETFDSWDKRARHLASHFQQGMTIDQWVGDCAIFEPMASMVQARTAHSSSSGTLIGPHSR